MGTMYFFFFQEVKLGQGLHEGNSTAETDGYIFDCVSNLIVLQILLEGMYPCNIKERAGLIHC